MIAASSDPIDPPFSLCCIAQTHSNLERVTCCEMPLAPTSKEEEEEENTPATQRNQ